MTPSQVIALINAAITSNGVGAITGPILNSILIAIVNLFSSAPALARIITASTPATIALTDNRVGFLRSTSLGATTAQMPTGAAINQEFIIQDLSGNFFNYPITVLAPSGQTFAGGRGQYVMNENNQTARFAYYGSNVWGVEAS
jgi:hypothetical protein